MANANRKAMMKKLKEAKAGGVGNNIRDGKYRWVVKKMSLEEGFKGLRFQVTFTVMHSNKIDVVSAKTNEVLDIMPDPVGRDVDWLQMLDGPDAPGPGNVKRLFMDLFNKKEISEDEYIETVQEMADLDADGSPLEKPLNLARGMMIDGETKRTVTKKKGIEIVVIKWSNVEQTEEQRLENCAWLDSLTAHQATQAATTATATA